MGLIIAGERSGAGKTTITLALLSFLRKRGEKVQSFKVGPDYIDPMFHEAITTRPCRNLDPILTSEVYVKFCFNYYSQGVDRVVIEGVMGLFDGVSFPHQHGHDYASTAHIARLLQLPVLLVIDCSRLSVSVAALAQGYCTFDPRFNVAGVILNRVRSDRHRELLEGALESLNIPVFGVFYRQEELTLRDRHLGLIPVDELADFPHKIDRLAHFAETGFDWPQLLPLLTPPSSHSLISPIPVPPLLRGDFEAPLRLAVARDRAFNFYYPDNLDLLQQLGVELVFWSPLANSQLPPDIHGLYFGGGFPEIFAQTLAENTGARQTVKRAIEGGLPTYAECGGLMYLSQNLTDLEGETWPMVGILPTSSYMHSHLTLGYRQGTVLGTSPFCHPGETFWGHEFHRSQLTIAPPQPLWELRSLSKGGGSAIEGWSNYHLHASYLHLHWGSHPEIPQRMLQKMCPTLPIIR